MKRGEKDRATAFEFSGQRHSKLNFVGDDVPDWERRVCFLCISVRLTRSMGTSSGTA